MPSTYPSHWPRFDKFHPDRLQSRITEQQKCDLYERKITTRDLAKLLNVSEKHLSAHFNGKVPIPDKRVLAKARREYKLEVARQVLHGKYSVQQAADVAYVSYNTMLRFTKHAKKLHPELIQVYELHLQERSKLQIAKARKAKSP